MLWWFLALSQSGKKWGKKDGGGPKMKFVKGQHADETLEPVSRMSSLHLLEPNDRLRCMQENQPLPFPGVGQHLLTWKINLILEKALF